MSELSDQDILKLCEGENPNYGFNLLLKKYQKRIYWHIRRIVIIHEDADDVCQNTFVKVWKNLKGFKGDSALYSWLYRIATNESLNHLKKNKGFFVSMDSHMEKISGHLESDSLYSGDEISKKLQQAILLLPEKQRLVFNMKYFEDLKYEEISDILQTSIGALKASYHHAVKKIEQMLKNSDF